MEKCDGQCSSCGSASCKERTEQEQKPLHGRKNIKHVYGVFSGKGGVGKSLVCGLLACELRKSGKKVGILDADITGPCIPRMFGLKPPLTADDDGINPAITSSGIKAVSINLMLPEEDMPVAWRGPVINGVLQQFWNEVNWEDLDVLLVDMPPGTSDVAFTALGHMDMEGIITVSAPQELVGIIVGKAVNFAANFDVPILGLVENMAYYPCEKCGTKNYLFGKPQGEEICKKYHIQAYAQLPINPAFTASCDSGTVEEIDAHNALEPILAALKTT